MAICRPCLAIPCTNPADLASGIDGAIYSALDYSFLISCPDNCFCPPGLFPQTISILASVIPPVIPPIDEPGAPIILRLQGCTSLLTRTLSTGSSQDTLKAAAQSMQAEWAGQQALCNALATPGVNCAQPSGLIDVCNDAFSFTCYDEITYEVPSGIYCQKLDVTGMTIAQEQAAIEQIKANLNLLAKKKFCPAFGVACSIQMVVTPNPGQWVVNIWMQNVANQSEDLSAFQFFVGAPGPATFYPPSPPIPATSIAGLTGPIAWSGVFSGAAHAFALYWSGIRIFNMPTSNNDTKYDVFVVVGCGDT